MVDAGRGGHGAVADVDRTRSTDVGVAAGQPGPRTTSGGDPTVGSRPARPVRSPGADRRHPAGSVARSRTWRRVSGSPRGLVAEATVTSSVSSGSLIRSTRRRPRGAAPIAASRADRCGEHRPVRRVGADPLARSRGTSRTRCRAVRPRRSRRQEHPFAHPDTEHTPWGYGIPTWLLSSQRTLSTRSTKVAPLTGAFISGRYFFLRMDIRVRPTH